MRRALVTAMLSFLVTAVWNALATKMPYMFNVLFLPPIILVFVSQYFKPIEIILVSLMCGLFVDVLGGFPIGFNILLMLVIAVAINLLNVFSSKIYSRDFIYYVIAVSFVYRLSLLLSQFVFIGPKTNIYLTQLFLGPLIDGVVSIPFYALLVQFLTLIRSFDRSDFFKNRIGYRQ